ncbi:hypothetical protein BD410DRAFT_786353 [Rickenella mellea]|uniref:Uncharacterized protein n=1 Tax=Rickenella mellea TaxID=50990 RepID=A0A4Y7Q9H8_9AGAM|nr:hypothetical protein BD410DRAFT_786353 [Rickenella mellea]
MAAVSPNDNNHVPHLHEASSSGSPNEKSMLAAFSPSLIVADLDLKDHRFPAFTSPVTTDERDNRLRGRMSLERGSAEKGSSGSPRTSQSEGVLYRQVLDDVRRRHTDDPPTQDVSPTDLSPPRSLPKPPALNDTASFNVNGDDETGRLESRLSNGTSSQQRILVTSPSPMTDQDLRRRSRDSRLDDPDVVPDRSSPMRDASRTYTPSTPKHPSAPGPSSGQAGTRASYPIIPSSASPSYRQSQSQLQNQAQSQPQAQNPTVSVAYSSGNRAFAQQPTFITPPAPPPNPVNPVYSPGPPPRPPQEEVCIECAMRDQDMADIDVTGPGVWDRESDVYYQDLLRKEEEEEAAMSRPSTPHRRPSDPNRPRAKGGRLTEQNLKVWLTMNPKEPQTRHQTIELYVKTQSSLLEAEALARARAMQESRALENRMRETYQNMRRSTHDLNGNSMTPIPLTLTEPETPSRLKHHSRNSRSATLASTTDVRHSRHHSRDVTLLENGLLVEHVDVRKEEKEERERRRKEEKRERSRARKLSRSSAVDVTSMYSVSAPSPVPHPDSGFHTISGDRDVGGGGGGHQSPRSFSRYSQSSSRPMSVSTMPITPQATRPSNGRLPSQVSLVDTQSISSTSVNRASRFFAFKNWSHAWRSQESFAQSGMSGSMMDMHVALDNERHLPIPHQPVDMGNNTPSLLLSEQQQWPSRRSMDTERGASMDRPKKKKGLAKIWNLFTGNKAEQNDANSQRSRDIHSNGTEDDLPLAPPPPLSYLVSRTTGDRIPQSPRSVNVNGLTLNGSVGGANSQRPVSSGSPQRSSGASQQQPMVTPPGSSLLATPTSPYHAWQEPHIVEEGRNDGEVSPVMEEDAQYLQTPGKENSRVLHGVLSAPDMRQRLQESFSTPSLTQSPPPTTMTHHQRPMSVMSLHKNLPPLPHESSSSVQTPSEGRRQTMYAFDSSADTAEEYDSTPNGMLSPYSTPRGPDVRRQSFGGMATKPPLPPIQTYPVTMNGSGGKYIDMATTTPVKGGGPHPAFAYTEFGGSRHSLGRFDDMRRFENGNGNGNNAEKTPTTPSKRRSKYGLAALLGRKPQTPVREAVGGQMPDASRVSSPEFGYGVREDVMAERRGSPLSTYQSKTRLSVASRKAIDALVDQDPDFVAYRYPSVDQHLTLGKGTI